MSPERIILALDDRRLIEQYTEVLVASGYEVYQCGSSENVIQAVLDHQAALVVIDSHRPDTSSYDLIDIINRTPETAHTKVILLTPIIDHAGRERATQLGASGVFINSVAGLSDAVSRICQLVPLPAGVYF